jgi:hypothetical protein
VKWLLVVNIITVLLACSGEGSQPTCKDEPHPWPRCRTAELNARIGDACQRARTRAAVALYKLRAEAPVEVQSDGIAQALELGEWMRMCDHRGSYLMLTAVQSNPPDLNTIRQQLADFTQVEAH